VHGLESDYFGRINFVYLDIDDSANDAFKKQLGYRYQPHLLLLDGDGNIVEQWVGPVTKDELGMAFDNLLSQ
jgi:hypothetical protein